VVVFAVVRERRTVRKGTHTPDRAPVS
jgi:hypothetical protein